MTGSVKRTVKNTFTGNEGILTAAASSDAEMSDSDRQAADQCIDKDGL